MFCKKIIFLVFLCLMLPLILFISGCGGGTGEITSASSQQTSLEARILLGDTPPGRKDNEKTVTALQGALVTLVGTGKSGYTDNQGYVKIIADAGTYTVTVTKEGYLPLVYSNVSINQNQSTMLGGSQQGVTIYSSSNPGISDLSITTGAAGDTITINGVNFGSSRTAVNGSITFNGYTVPSYAFSSWSSSQIVCAVPVSTTGNIVVSANGNNSPGVNFTATNPLWTRTYNGSGNDVGYGIAVDSAGYVYVTGYETVTDQGANIWTRKYDTSGNTIWTQAYNGTANDNDEAGNGIAVDSAGYVYVTGYETVTDHGANIWTRKYDSSGNTIWTQTYNGAANGNDIGYGVAVDSLGYVYVTGYENVTGQGANIWTRKYDNDGNTIWTKTYNNSSNGDDLSYGVAVDSLGYVYVTGYETLGATWKSQIWTRKYDKDGNTVWTQTYKSSTYTGNYSLNIGYGISIDSNSNIYVTGSTATASLVADMWTRKYDSSGNTVWTKTQSSSGRASGGNGITVDSNGFVYIAGFEGASVGGSATDNIWTWKYDSSGNIIWTKTYSGAPNNYDSGQGVAVDSLGNVYVTGFETVTGHGYNIWTRKYDSSGNTL